MAIANHLNWKEEFNVPISTLISKSKLNRNDIYKSRNKLKQFKLLDFKERPGNLSSSYKLKSIVSVYGTQNVTQTDTQISTEIVTQNMTQSVNILQTKNLKPKTKNKETIANAIEKKNAFGEFKNVLLTNDELNKLKSRFSDDYGERIERLSSYIASSGKRKTV
jgi:hypothetical protein